MFTILQKCFYIHLRLLLPLSCTKGSGRLTKTKEILSPTKRADCKTSSLLSLPLYLPEAQFKTWSLSPSLSSKDPELTWILKPLRLHWSSYISEKNSIASAFLQTPWRLLCQPRDNSSLGHTAARSSKHLWLHGGCLNYYLPPLWATCIKSQKLWKQQSVWSRNLSFY